MAPISVGANVSLDKIYVLPGQPDKVDAVAYQNAIMAYASLASDKNKSLIMSFKQGLKELADFKVFGCFGMYKNDEYCMRCPTRKSCIVSR